MIDRYLLLFLQSIAVAFITLRLSRLLAIDTVFEWLRERIRKRIDGKKDKWWYLSELIHCQFCLSVWLSFFVSLLICSPLHGFSNWLFVWAVGAGIAELFACIGYRDVS